jgi:predicted permease
MIADDKSSEAIERAKSYFLIFATIGDCLTFAVGTRLIDNEYAPDLVENSVQQDEEHSREQVEERLLESGEPLPTEETSLVPDNVRAAENRIEHKFHVFSKERWNRLPPRLQVVLSFLDEFFNAPLIGASIGTLIGLVSPLHGLFFAETFDGGWLTSWLTASLRNIGQLFVTLQVVVAGVTLSSSLRKMKRGEDGGSVPWLPATLVLIFRFVLWPAVSISLVWTLASKTSILGDNPILWFAMCLMPCRPTAMKLIPMVDVSEGADEERMSIAKLLTVSAASNVMLVIDLCRYLTWCLRSCPSP